MDSSDFKGCAPGIAIVACFTVVAGCFQRQDDARTIREMREGHQALVQRLKTYQKTLEEAQTKCKDRLLWHQEGEKIDFEMMMLKAEAIHSEIKRKIGETTSMEHDMQNLYDSIRSTHKAYARMIEEVTDRVDSIPALEME